MEAREGAMNDHDDPYKGILGDGEDNSAADELHKSSW